MILPETANFAATYDGLLEELEEFDDRSGDGSNIVPRGKGILDRRLDKLVEGNGEDLVGNNMFGDGRRASWLGGRSASNIGEDNEVLSNGFGIVIGEVPSESPAPGPPSEALNNSK